MALKHEKLGFPLLSPHLVGQLVEALFAITFAAQELGLETRLDQYRGPAGKGAWRNAHDTLVTIREMQPKITNGDNPRRGKSKKPKSPKRWSVRCKTGDGTWRSVESELTKAEAAREAKIYERKGYESCVFEGRRKVK